MSAPGSFSPQVTIYRDNAKDTFAAEVEHLAEQGARKLSRASQACLASERWVALDSASFGAPEEVVPWKVGSRRILTCGNSHDWGSCHPSYLSAI